MELGLKVIRAALALVIVAGCLSALACRSSDVWQTPAVRERPASTTPNPTPVSSARHESEIQRAVNEVFAGGNMKAAAVVLSVKPRAILALGRHGADPTTLSLRPGSTVKPLLAFGAAEAGLLKPGAKLTCTGAYGPLDFKCPGQHGAITLPEAIAASCNVYFFELADRLGFEGTSRTFAHFGFGSETGLSSGEAAGRLPSAEWLRLKQEPATRSELWKGWVLQVGGGHGPLEVTLLQLAVAYAMLGEALTERATERDAASAWAEISEGLRRTVRDPKGTGHLAQVSGVDIAGKTGSAEAGTFGDDFARARPDNGWFVGYAPAAAPDVVVAVVVLEGGAGGSSSAAPLARNIFAAWHAARAPSGGH